MAPYSCPTKCCPDFSGFAIQPTVPSTTPILMIVGDAPSDDEVKYRKLFVGKAGTELTNYLDRADIPRERCYLTCLIKCKTPGNRDPYQTEISTCSHIFLKEVETVNPRYIVTVGRVATQHFLGDVNMEAVHGVPHKVGTRIIIPVYDPAAGLHDTTAMSNIMTDFLAVKATMMNQLEVRVGGAHVTPPPYVLVQDGQDIAPFLTDLVAIDTETQDEQDTPWCLQFCCGGRGYVLMHSNTVSLRQFADHVANPNVLCIIHNSLFDLKVLDLMGVHPANFTDTMIMAYLLQTEPQGLKPLVMRHLNVKMSEYTEVVGPYTQQMAMDYLVQAATMEWPKLPPILEMKAGQPKVRQPQSVNQKANRILNDLTGGKDVDIFERWYKMKPEEGRSMVEAVLGPMRKAYLMDVDEDVAMQYAATDAWATYLIYPILMKKIRALGLEDVLDRDNGVVTMVETMQRSGITVDPDYFRKLGTEFTTEMDRVTVEVEEMVGPVHIGSDPQVLALLERLNVVKAKRKIVNGKEVVVRKKMTDLKALEVIKHLHPVIPKIMRYRALAKLVDSFINVLLEKMDEDRRIRTTLRITRVVTGRLSSSNPNLMAQPTRTEDGRKIRGGFIAKPGYTLLSGDYSQVEMRVVAHISQDVKMLEVFRTGVDIHSATASGMFGIPIDKLDEMAHRYPAKRVGFGILNLISAEKLLLEFVAGGATGWTVAKCQNTIDSWFTLYYGVKQYVIAKQNEARSTGMVRDLFGRIRLVPEVMSVHRSIVEAGYRQAVNAPIQMGAQGIIKEAMRQLVPVYKGFDGLLVPLLQIHDDLMWEVEDSMLPVVKPIIKDVMENCVQLSVPLRVDFKEGKCWSTMKKCK